MLSIWVPLYICIQLLPNWYSWNNTTLYAYAYAPTFQYHCHTSNIVLHFCPFFSTIVISFVNWLVSCCTIRLALWLSRMRLPIPLIIIFLQTTTCFRVPTWLWFPVTCKIFDFFKMPLLFAQAIQTWPDLPCCVLDFLIYFSCIATMIVVKYTIV